MATPLYLFALKMVKLILKHPAIEKEGLNLNESKRTKRDLHKILYLYAKGMTTREIADTFKEVYGADISLTLISRASNAVIEPVIEWQAIP